jgi:protein-disulfide isomerase
MECAAARPRLRSTMPRARLAAPALAVVGIAVSAASLIDCLRPAPAFCAADGCAAVRASAWAHPLGLPLPVVGLVFFAAALVLAAMGPRAATARRALALTGGVGALGLLGVQAFVIGAWCKLCLVADLAALAHAVVVGLSRAPWTPPRRIVLAMAGALAVVIPLAATPPAPATTVTAPADLAGEIVPGQVVVVDFVDFECPFCRAFHERLRAAMDQAGVPVRLVRKMVPLDRHPGALPAALAWCCADAQGRGDPMAEALIALPVAELTPDGCARLAASLGLDMDRYAADLRDPATRARIDTDRALARDAGIHSLPTIFIAGEAFVGASATVDQLVASLQRAAS